MSPEEPENRWLSSAPRRGADYDKRFQELEAAGQYLHGEADFISSFGVASVLDAGCGTGRVAIELARRGIHVVGVDIDDKMLAAAREKAPEITWVTSDLATFVLDQTFDMVALPGNVMIFLTPGTEGAVVANLASYVNDGGYLIAGFSLEKGRLDLATYDELTAAAGLELADRWSTWGRDPYSVSSNYAVSVHHKP